MPIGDVTMDEMRGRRLLLNAALATAFVAMTGRPLLALADEARLVLNAEPASLTPRGDATGTVLLVVKNPAAVDAAKVRIRTFPDEGIKLEAAQPLIETLKADSEGVFELKVSAPDGPVDGRVLLRVDYTMTPAGHGPVERSSVATITVKTEESQPIAQIVDVSVKTTLESLDELRSGRLYLVVANKSDRPIKVNAIQVQSPDFLKVEPPAGAVTLAPRELSVLEMRISATKVIEPGKHLLVFKILGERQRFGRTETWQTVSSHEVTVGVFGESEVLKLLGVPSFFLLPGVLALLTIGWLWKSHVLQPKQTTLNFGLTKDTPEFWVAGITISGVIAYAYRFFVGRNYLVAYGLQDVIRVWMLSIVVFGLGVYLLIALGIRLWNWYYLFDRKQKPVAALKRFERHHLGLRFPRHTLTLNGATKSVFVVKVEGDQTWVASAIQWQWLATNDSSKLKLAGERNAATRPGTLANVLARQEKSKSIVVNWQEEGLRQVPSSALTNPQAPTPIVEEA